MPTLLRIALLASGSFAGIAHAEPLRATSAQAVARATILRPLALRIGSQSSRLEMSPEHGAPIAARKVQRPCGTDTPGRCMLIVYDLP